jgi:hypothetical protein
MHKILHYQQWCFSRIRQEKFQGNPGNLLVFFTVCSTFELNSKNRKKRYIKRTLFCKNVTEKIPNIYIVKTG